MELPTTFRPGNQPLAMVGADAQAECSRTIQQHAESKGGFTINLRLLARRKHAGEVSTSNQPKCISVGASHTSMVRDATHVTPIPHHSPQLVLRHFERN